MYQRDLLMTFHSTHQAIRSDKLLQELQVLCELIPTPRQISAGCGLSLELASAEAKLWLPCLQRADIRWGGIYQRRGEQFTPWMDTL